MDSKGELAKVGLFVIIASALLIATVLYLSGTLSGNLTPYRTYFNNAGGLTPGAEVRYEGGPRIGRIKKVAPDPKDPTRMEIDFAVEPDTPVYDKQGTFAKIESTSALGENYLGLHSVVSSGPKAHPDSVIPSKDYVSIADSFADLGDMVTRLGPSAQTLMANLNLRVVEAKDTIARINNVLDEENQANIKGSLRQIHGILTDNRDGIRSSIKHIDEVTAKLSPLLDNFKVTEAKADELIQHLDKLVTDKRVQESIDKLRSTLVQANELTTRLNNLMDANSENLDEIIDNLRAVSDNMREFTETIKTRPYTLIRSSSPKPHEPGS